MKVKEKDKTSKTLIKNICKSFDSDPCRLMDILIEVQHQCRQVSNAAIKIVAEELKISQVIIEEMVSFYAFLSKEKKGKIIIRLCNDVVDKMFGADDIAETLEKTLKIHFGETSADGKFTLEYTPCIGMSDQAPAALINDTVFPNLTIQKTKKIISDLKANKDPSKIVQEIGDGNNADNLIKSAVKNNIHKKGFIVFASRQAESGLRKALSVSPQNVINEIKNSNLRGRGGAGFPTGLKWEFTSNAAGKKKIVMCNADEGEPGTFKDRALLTEYSHLLFEGMTIAAYAISADIGILYLRAEYTYLRKFLESQLKQRREKGLLGKNILGKKGFSFDIRIQAGAGAYICGEETALINSCEGSRGDPKTRPPFPAQKGYLGYPTIINNVETFCCVSRILEIGASSYSLVGSQASLGTKLLSISGDCRFPGIYEYPFGIRIKDILSEVGAVDTKAVLIGGPSGQFIGPDDFNRKICFSDLATGGSFVIFNSKRNLLEIAREYMEFFVEESCGYCTPCRVGNILMKNKLEDIINGKGELSDLQYLKELGDTIKFTSRCGLGQTSPNPIITTLKAFPSIYEKAVKKEKSGLQPSFDIKSALRDAEAIAGRQSEIF